MANKRIKHSILDDHEIQKIVWENEHGFSNISVGEKGVTKIDSIECYLGEDSIVWLQIWKNKKLIARCNAQNIDTIFYGELGA